MAYSLYLSYLYFCSAQCCQRKTKMYKNTLYRQMGNTGEIYESLRILEYVREIKKQNDLFYTHMVKYSKLINISLLESASKRSCSQFFFKMKCGTLPVSGLYLYTDTSRIPSKKIFIFCSFFVLSEIQCSIKLFKSQTPTFLVFVSKQTHAVKRFWRQLIKYKRYKLRALRSQEKMCTVNLGQCLGVY